MLMVGTLLGDAAVPRHYDPAAAERGYKNLTTKNYSPAVWSMNAYANAWRRWPGVKEKPANYDAAFREHYGLHAAPFDNNNLPMGMHEGRRLLGKGVALNCMLCHGGSINGQSYIGLPNSTIDIQAFFEDLNGADGLPPMTPFSFGTVRGTTEAGAFAVFLLGLRNPDLSLRKMPIDLGLHDDLCEDPPAWWLLKKKKTMYWTGGADQRSVRSIMQFMMSPLNGPKVFHAAEADFSDIRQYFLSIEAPAYPYSIDRELAAEGELLFRANCARCHGTYGPDGRYPNKIIALEEIGTDRTRFDGIEKPFGEYYDRSWFAQEQAGWFSTGYTAKPSTGYQAPPLDGIWATAPFFHNGSVPTVYHVINSAARPTRFLRTFRTGAEDYDTERLGWKTSDAGPPNPSQPAIERRKVYDTRQPGRGNGGHTFGDHLTDAERLAIVEYLKTL
jgi:mono/diheme cytochrome c family protein